MHKVSRAYSNKARVDALLTFKSPLLKWRDAAAKALSHLTPPLLRPENMSLHKHGVGVDGAHHRWDESCSPEDSYRAAEAGPTIIF